MSMHNFKNDLEVTGNNPVVPFIIGDGIGKDITPVMIKVVDAAVDKIYAKKRKINWLRVYAGEDAIETSGLDQGYLSNISDDSYQKILLPKETLEAFNKYKIGIKGPLSTPVGDGFKSLNVALRQKLDLYACIRPIKWYEGVPTPIKDPYKIDMIIFRENTEDVYCGIEWAHNSDEAKTIRGFLKNFGLIIPQDAALGLKQVSESSSKRLVRAAINYALKNNRKSVTLVHKGNIMKYTEGGFLKWGYEVAQSEFRNYIVTEMEYQILDIKNKYPNTSLKDISVKINELGFKGKETEINKILELLEEKNGGKNLEKMLIVNDRIADQMFQQLIIKPREYDVIATLNLNGDYLSDACAAEVGGLGIAPGANINFETGHAIFEATHGTSPKHANQNRANPSSIILSAVMMLQYMNWNEVAELIQSSITKTFSSRIVTQDLYRQLENAKLVSCTDFGDTIIKNMDNL